MTTNNSQKLEQRYKIYERVDSGRLLVPTKAWGNDIYEYDGYDSHDDAFDAIQEYANKHGYGGIRDLIIVAEVGWVWED